MHTEKTGSAVTSQCACASVLIEHSNYPTSTGQQSCSGFDLIWRVLACFGLTFRSQQVNLESLKYI